MRKLFLKKILKYCIYCCIIVQNYSTNSINRRQGRLLKGDEATSWHGSSYAGVAFLYKEFWHKAGKVKKGIEVNNNDYFRK